MFSRAASLVGRWVAIGAILLLATIPATRLEAGTDAPYKTVRLFSTQHVDAHVFADRFGLKPEWVIPRKALRLKGTSMKIEVEVHSIVAMLNGLRVFLSEPVVAQNGRLYLARGDANHLLGAILRPHRSPSAVVKTIVLDPGHGGKDPGNQNRALKLDEKRLTLEVAQRAAALLKAQGYRVVLTRTDDRFVDFDDRAALIRKHRADLFISIHFNGFSRTAINGIETLVMTPRHQRSTPQAESDRRMRATPYAANRPDHTNTILGYHMHRKLFEKLGNVDRGLKRFRYRVLRNATCPAVLIEAGFLSNAAEARRIASAAYQQNIATAIVAGVKAYAAAIGGNVR